MKCKEITIWSDYIGVIPEGARFDDNSCLSILAGRGGSIPPTLDFGVSTKIFRSGNLVCPLIF